MGLVNCASQELSTKSSLPSGAEVGAVSVASGNVNGPATLQESLRQLDMRVKQLEGEVDRANKGVQLQKVGRSKLKKETTKLAKKLATDKKCLHERLAQLQQIKIELKNLESMKDAQVLQKADLEKKHADVTGQSRPVEVQLAEAKDKYEKSLRETDEIRKKLESARDEQAKATAEVESQLRAVKSHLSENREKTAVLEKEIRQGRQHLQRLEEQVKNSESEVHETDARLNDGQVRLKELNAKLGPQEAEMNQRLQAADRQLGEQNGNAAKLKMDRAQVDQMLQRKLASDRPAMALQLRRKAAGNSMKTRRTCQIYKSPSFKSKVVGSKRAGAVVSGSMENNWMALALPNGVTGFVPSNCFGSRL
jgi:chromosome segregation ATPase